MQRRYVRVWRPAVVALEGVDVIDAVEAIERTIEDTFGTHVYVREHEGCIVLPPPHEVWVSGRTLRGDEIHAYERACGIAVGRVTGEARYAIEAMVGLDWPSFDAACWTRLGEAEAALPGWLGAEDLPRWLGRDETRGPAIWASVEPPGLHIVGVVEPTLFERWLGELVIGIEGLPMR